MPLYQFHAIDSEECAQQDTAAARGCTCQQKDERFAR